MTKKEKNSKCDSCKYKKKVTAKTEITVSESKPTWKTSFMVFVYAIVVGICLGTQAILNLIPSLIDNGIIKSNYWISILNSDLTMPLDVLSFIWVTIVSTYIGVDRGLYAARSFTLTYGKTDIGDPHTIRIVILVSGLLFLEAILCNVICRGDYALTEFATGFGMSCCLYVAGQKVIKAGKSVSGTHNADELHKKQTEAKEPQPITNEIPITEDIPV